MYVLRHSGGRVPFLVLDLMLRGMVSPSEDESETKLGEGR